MALSDPITAYNAANNIEAVMVQHFLESAGIESYVSEDNSLVGQWMGGMLPEIHKPQVWVDRSNAERVAQLLREYEQRRAAQRNPEESSAPAEVAVVCEQCGSTSTFPGSKRGSTQDCLHCGAAVDVGEVDWPYDDEWAATDEAEADPD